MAARVLPPAPVRPEGMAPARYEKLARTARDFEAQAFGQMLQPVFATLRPGQGLFGGGSAEAQWQGLLVDAYAKVAARAGGVGLAQPVLREMLRMQAAADGPPTLRQPSLPQDATP